MRSIIAGIFLVLMMYGWFRLIQEVIRMEDEMHKPKERSE